MYNLKIVTYEATGEQDIKTYSRPIGAKQRDKPETEEGEKEEREPTIRDMISKANHSLNSSMSRTKQTIYDYARANKWEWFVTWTTDPNKVDRFDYESVTDKLSKWLNNQRARKAPELKYIIVPEQHKNGAWHFHGLLSFTGKLTFDDSGHQANGMTVYNLTDWKLGFTTATQIRDTLKASNYITKYITKELISLTKGQRRYWNSKNLDTGQVETDCLDSIALNLIHDAYMEGAKRHKKIVVDRIGYHNEMNIFTL